MKKIIFLLIVFFGLIHHTSNASTLVRRSVSFVSIQEKDGFSQSLLQSDFIGTDLLELTEDELNHFEKKLIETLKTAYNRNLYSLAVSLTILPTKIRPVSLFTQSISTIHSFIGVYRI
ncbi:MAG: hypothetical protein WCP74_03865 [Sphingobacteriia bacterium]|jgi:hypothetical protein